MSKVIEVTDLSELGELSGYCVVKFWAPWCGTCSHLTPNLEKLVKGTDYQMVNCNVDDSQEIAVKFNIRSLPTTIILNDGWEINRMIGNQPIPVIENFLGL